MYQRSTVVLTSTQLRNSADSHTCALQRLGKAILCERDLVSIARNDTQRFATASDQMGDKRGVRHCYLSNANHWAVKLHCAPTARVRFDYLVLQARSSCKNSFSLLCAQRLLQLAQAGFTAGKRKSSHVASPVCQ